jgi:RimJ/RimL family protein N-acetyltransferase
MEVKIRQAVLEDFTEIDFFDVFAGDRKSEIQRNEVWVAILQGKIAAYITFNHSFYQKPFIQYLNVKLEYRKQGIGQALIKSIEKRCNKEKLFTSTESNNLSMIRLLERRKFKLVGVIEQLQEVAEIIYCKEIKRKNQRSITEIALH